MCISGLPLARMCGRPLRARFLARPNRFIAQVALPGGENVVAYLPNPGRLTGTLTPGSPVLLDGPYPPPRACAYTVIAARERGTLVGTVTTYANELFAALWPLRAFPELPGSALRAEVARGGCRFDFQIDRAFVEVKSVTFARGRLGLFPDAVTERGARHCLELARMARRGTPAALVFVAQRGDIDAIAPAEEVDPRFARALRRAASAGVSLLGCAVEMTPAGARRARRVPVLLRPGGAI